MAVRFDDEIEELWRGPLSQRERNWLWVCLKYYPYSRPRLLRGPQEGQAAPLNWWPPGFSQGSIEHELLFFLRYYSQQNPSIPKPIQQLKSEKSFVRENEFDWIKDDARQSQLCVNQAQTDLSVFIPDAQARFGNREYLISMLDIQAASILEKHHYLNQLKYGWELHSKKTSYLSWFKSDDEGDRCKFAWECLSNRPSLRWKIGLSQFSSVADVQLFFDNLVATDDEKKGHVDYVKKLWSQKKYRERQEKKNVKQYNFVFTGDTNRNLDKIAKQLGVSRTEVLEQLIYYAARYGMPLGPTQPLMSPPPSTTAR